MPLPIENVDDFTLFDLNEYNHLLMLAKRDFKDVDIHLLEYLIASYLIYDSKGITRPTEDNEEFKRVQNKLNQLLEQQKIDEEREKEREKERE